MDLLQEIKSIEIDDKLNVNYITTYHSPSRIKLRVDYYFWICKLYVLYYHQGRLSSTWHNKPTDTGLILNYHALAWR